MPLLRYKPEQIVTVNALKLSGRKRMVFMAGLILWDRRPADGKRRPTSRPLRNWSTPHSSRPRSVRLRA